MNKNIPALLTDSEFIEIWILTGPHTEPNSKYHSVRNEEIEVLGKKIKIQTNGKFRALFYDSWSYNVEMGKDYRKYLGVWKELHEVWNQGSVST